MTEKEKKAKEEKEEKQKKVKKMYDEHAKFDGYLADGTMKGEFTKYLGIDGVLILELINRNSNEIVTSAGKYGVNRVHDDQPTLLYQPLIQLFQSSARSTTCTWRRR